MNRKQYLLNKLAEEANEITKEALKGQAFGMDSVSPYNGKTNKENLIDELDDFLAIVKMLNCEYQLNYIPDGEKQMAKIAKVDKYYKIARDLGQIK